MTGTVTNEGPREVSNVVLVYSSASANLHPRETEYALGELNPGESRDFKFRIDVSSEAEPGPRQMEFTVRYRNGNDDVRESDPIDATARVGEDFGKFDLESSDARVTVGSSNVITVRVENTAGQPLTDIEAKMFTDAPLSSDDDTAYIDRLEPGEATEITFNVAAAGSATVKEYPISIDFSYEDARGDTELSDTYRLPVTVIEPSDQGLPTGFLVAGLVIPIGILAWWKRDSISAKLR